MIIFKARPLKWNQHAIQLSYIDCWQRKVCCNYTTHLHVPSPLPSTTPRSLGQVREELSYQRSYHFTRTTRLLPSHTVRWTDNRTSERAGERAQRNLRTYVHIRQRESRDKCCLSVCVCVCVFVYSRVCLHTFGTLSQKSAKPQCSRVDDIYLFDIRTQVEPVPCRVVDPSIHLSRQGIQSVINCYQANT